MCFSPGHLGFSHPQEVHVAGKDRQMRVWYILQLCPRVPIAQEYISDELQACLPPHWLAKQNHPCMVLRAVWKLTASKSHLLTKPLLCWDALASTATTGTRLVPGLQAAHHCSVCTTGPRYWSMAQREAGFAFIQLFPAVRLPPGCAL